MAERCRTDCPIFVLSKGHIVCSPLVRKAVERRTLKFMDSHDESTAAALGSLTASVIEEVDLRIETLDRRLNEVAGICVGPDIVNVGGRLALVCGGFSADDLEAILDTQQDMINRLGPESY